MPPERDPDIEAYCRKLKAALNEVVHPGECRRISDNRGQNYSTWIGVSEYVGAMGDRQKVCDICGKYRWSHERCAVFQAGHERITD